MTNNMTDKLVLEKDEYIIWRGKPDKRAFADSVILQRSVVVFLALIGVVFVGSINLDEDMQFLKIPIFVTLSLLFFSYPLTWMAQLFLIDSMWKRTEYIITNDRIMKKDRSTGYIYRAVEHKHIEHIERDNTLSDKKNKTSSFLVSINVACPRGVRPFRLSFLHEDIVLIYEAKKEREVLGYG